MLDFSFFLHSNSCKDVKTFQPKKEICFSMKLFFYLCLFYTVI